jgi:ADP-ribose pyrophosphatase YjhB (NUDIX family)
MTFKRVIEWFLKNDAGTAQTISQATGESAEAVGACLETLVFWGLVRLRPNGQIGLIHADHARLVLMSFSHFLERGWPLLADLDREGRERTWPQVLRALEWRRQHLDKNAPPIRSVNSAVALIVGIDDRNQRHILVEHETWNNNIFEKLPGGTQQAGETASQTVRRELTEEIQPHVDRVLTLSAQPAVTVRDRDVSRKTGALTDYTVSVFTVDRFTGEPFDYTGALSHSLRWLPVRLINERVQAAPVMLFRRTFLDPAVRRHIEGTGCTYRMGPRESGMSLDR